MMEMQVVACGFEPKTSSFDLSPSKSPREPSHSTSLNSLGRIVHFSPGLGSHASGFPSRISQQPRTQVRRVGSLHAEVSTGRALHFGAFKGWEEIGKR